MTLEADRPTGIDTADEGARMTSLRAAPSNITPPEDLPTVCPVCGGYSLNHEHSMSILLAVCDVLVVKALEKLGNYLTRAERSRYHAMRGMPAHEAHTRWPAPDALVDKALKGAWDVVPYVLGTHGALLGQDAEVVTATLDRYVHDLAITGESHDMGELMYRLQTYLGLPVYRKPEAAGAEHELS